MDRLEVFIHCIVTVNTMTIIDIFAENGSTVNLTCVFTNLSYGDTITWLVPPYLEQYAVGDSVMSNYTQFKLHSIKERSTQLQVFNFSQHNTGEYRCQTKKEEICFEVLLKVPPHVSIVNTVLNSSINTTLECVAHGVPDSYSYNSWVHLTNNRSVVRHLASGNKVSVLSNSYEDSGIYICNVSNGVIDDNGNEWTTAEYYMNYSGKPVFTRTNLRAQFGHIYLYVVSPHPISVACVFNEPREAYGPNDSCHAKFNIKNTYTLIQDMLYSNIVGVYGYEIRLEAKLNVKIDNRNVTAQVQNKEGFSTYVVHFTAPGRQDERKDLVVILPVAMILASTGIIALICSCYMFFPRRVVSSIDQKPSVTQPGGVIEVSAPEMNYVEVDFSWKLKRGKAIKQARRTNYADIDFTKTAEPLPEEDTSCNSENE